MKKDAEIKKDIDAELKWDSRLIGSTVNTEVNKGHVTLSGIVDSYPKKVNSEKAVRGVSGVKSVSNDLMIEIPETLRRTDKEIEEAVRAVIKWNSTIDDGRIKITVNKGWVTLEGKTDWEYQKSKARILAEDITGVTGVTNLILVKSKTASSSDVSKRIEAALKRNYYLNTNNISVEVESGKAILTGKVRTLAEKGAAETAAWSAPGITQVVNELTIDHSEVFV